MVYDVPMAYQGKSQLCWAYCEAMVEAYYINIIRAQKGEDPMSPEEIGARAEEIADSKKGIDGVSNEAGKAGAAYILKSGFEALMEGLEAYGPLIANYHSDMGSNNGHYVVVTGAVSALGHEDLVLTNNPWGIKGAQTYEEFTTGYVGYSGTIKMPYKGVGVPNSKRIKELRKEWKSNETAKKKVDCNKCRNDPNNTGDTCICGEPK